MECQQHANPTSIVSNLGGGIVQSVGQAILTFYIAQSPKIYQDRHLWYDRSLDLYWDALLHFLLAQRGSLHLQRQLHALGRHENLVRNRRR